MKGRFSAVNLSKCERRAIHQRGLFTVESYDQINRYDIFIRAYSPSGKKSVDVRPIDMREAAEYYYGPWTARVITK